MGETFILEGGEGLKAAERVDLELEGPGISDLISSALWTRVFGYYAFPTRKGETRFLCYCRWKTILKKNGLESPLIFVFILKGKTK